MIFDGCVRYLRVIRRNLYIMMVNHIHIYTHRCWQPCENTGFHQRIMKVNQGLGMPQHVECIYAKLLFKHLNRSKTTWWFTQHNRAECPLTGGEVSEVSPVH